MRYSAKLLHQYRIVEKNRTRIMRTCAISIHVLESSGLEKAIEKFHKLGKSLESSYLNHDDDQVHFEFIGIMDLIDLGSEYDQSEVWFDVRTIKLPMEKKSNLIKTKEQLLLKFDDNNHKNPCNTGNKNGSATDRYKGPSLNKLLPKTLL